MRNACVLVALFFCGMTFAQTKIQAPGFSGLATPAVQGEESEGSRLPVKRVVLYKNGVGYFEHSAQVRGDQDLAIDFTTAQLNDVLKSLTVVDLGGGHISGVRYNSIAPLDERLKALRLPFGEQITQSDFLSALRGSRVEVRSKTETTTGRLLSVEQQQKTNNDSGETYTATEFSIITDSGEMQNYELGPTVSVRIADHDLNDEVGRYLKLVGSSRARDLRRMTISTSGSGDREIFVSYVSEVPVWKSTYRIILSQKPGEKPLLQGWAIVDNTIGEDWKDVQLSLIAGAPQSFIQDISQPLYTRRPVVPLPESAMLTPQTHEGTMSGEESAEAKVTPPPPPAAAAANGNLGDLVEVPKVVLPTKTRDFDRLQQFAQLQQAPRYAAIATAAESKDLGDYFEYNLKQNVTIGKNESALVPILQSPIEAEKVTLWTAGTAGPALRALWIKNASGLTLDSGTFNIIDADTFAGEGLMETVRPNERRLLSYAADTAVRVTSNSDFHDQPVSRIRVTKGIVSITHEQRNKVTYTIHNSDTAARQVVIEHPVREGWKLAEGLKPEETSATHYRFHMPVESGKTSELAVEEFHPEETTFALTDLTSNQMDAFVAQNRITPDMEQTFRRVLDQKNRIGSLQAQISIRQEEVNAITRDQARIRENMKALKGSAEEKELVLRYTRQLNSQEDRLGALNKEISDLQGQRSQEQQKLEAMVQQVTLDEKF